MDANLYVFCAYLQVSSMWGTGIPICYTNFKREGVNNNKHQSPRTKVRGLRLEQCMDPGSSLGTKQVVGFEIFPLKVQTSDDVLILQS